MTDDFLLEVIKQRKKGVQWKLITKGTGYNADAIRRQYKKRFGPLPSFNRGPRHTKQLVVYTTDKIHGQISLVAMNSGLTINQIVHNLLEKHFASR